MGEDAQELPPGKWHLELQQAFEEGRPDSGRIAVDLTSLDWLVGQDWGFLLGMAEQSWGRGTELVVIVSEPVMLSASVLQIDKKITVVHSLDELLLVGAGHYRHRASLGSRTVIQSTRLSQITKQAPIGTGGKSNPTGADDSNIS